VVGRDSPNTGISPVLRTTKLSREVDEQSGVGVITGLFVKVGDGVLVGKAGVLVGRAGVLVGRAGVLVGETNMSVGGTNSVIDWAVGSAGKSFVCLVEIDIAVSVEVSVRSDAGASVALTVSVGVVTSLSFIRSRRKIISPIIKIATIINPNTR
jgi:hypothetical protein